MGPEGILSFQWKSTTPDAGCPSLFVGFIRTPFSEDSLPLTPHFFFQNDSIKMPPK
jgi:hypothetical protein